MIFVVLHRLEKLPFVSQETGKSDGGGELSHPKGGMIGAAVNYFCSQFSRQASSADLNSRRKEMP